MAPRPLSSVAPRGSRATFSQSGACRPRAATPSRRAATGVASYTASTLAVPHRSRQSASSGAPRRSRSVGHSANPSPAPRHQAAFGASLSAATTRCRDVPQRSVPRTVCPAVTPPVNPFPATVRFECGRLRVADPPVCRRGSTPLRGREIWWNFTTLDPIPPATSSTSAPVSFSSSTALPPRPSGSVLTLPGAPIRAKGLVAGPRPAKEPRTAAGHRSVVTCRTRTGRCARLRRLACAHRRPRRGH